MTTLALPRFQELAQLVDSNGQPTVAFHIWWDTFASSLEKAFADQQAQIDAITAAQAAADAAQATANAAAHTSDWSGVNDDNGNKPDDNATLGADIGTNLTGQIDSSNVSTYVDTSTVDTAYLANNAVTNPTSAYSAGSITVPATSTWTDIQTVTITATGAPIQIVGSFYAGPNDAHTGSAATHLLQYRLVRDGTVIFGPVDFGLYKDAGSDQFGTGSNSCVLLDQPVAGSYTYKLQAYSAGNLCAPLSRSLMVMETKK